MGTTTAPESVMAMRNLILIGKVLGSINPEILHAVLEGIPQTTAGTGSETHPLFSPWAVE